MLHKKQILSHVRLHFICLCGVFLSVCIHAQVSDSSASVYAPVNENLFVNTKWKYTYTTHTQSNTIIHKANDEYKYFIFFRYDYSCQTHLNGILTDGVWKLNNEQNEIRYQFRNVNWWRLASFTEEALILEFTMNVKSSYRYHFIRVDDVDAPFVPSPNDLPVINVNYAQNSEQSESDRYINFLNNRGLHYNKKFWELRKARKERRRKNRTARLERTIRGREKLLSEEPKEMLQIELVGGGFYGGVDPVYRNIILIKTDGRVLREYQSKYQGLQVIRHTITREDLEQLLSFIEEKKFFEFDKIYTCQNQACINRLSKKPRPIALRIAITKGVRRKIISIPIWDGRGRGSALVDYPRELDAIVHAIETIANVPF